MGHPTPAVVIRILLLVIIRAQDLFVLLWEGRVRLTRLRAASTTMRLWSEEKQRERHKDEDETGREETKELTLENVVSIMTQFQGQDVLSKSLQSALIQRNSEEQGVDKD